MVGENIKKIRTEKGMTQKTLADMLFVTPQAVSRWENGEVEPSVSTVLEIAKIFGVTTDELLGTPKEEGAENAQTDAQKEEPKQEEKQEEKKQAPIMLALCSNCNQPIFNSSDIHRRTETVHYGRSSHTVEHIYCTKCDDRKKEEAKRKAEAARREKIARARKWRIWGYILGALFFLVSLIIGNSNNNAFPGEGHLVIGIVVGLCGFCVVDCLCLKNNFVGDMILEILSWGVIKFPGIIFSLDIEGCAFLIVMKILFKVIGILLGIAVGLLACVVGGVVAPFVLPFALVKSYRHPEEFDD